MPIAQGVKHCFTLNVKGYFCLVLFSLLITLSNFQILSKNVFLTEK